MVVSRREFFTDFARCMLPVSTAEAAVESADAPRRLWLRPPGALPEAAFLEKCTRCTDCLVVCPHDSIRRLGPEFGERAGTPAIIPHESPCYLCADLPCIDVCLPGALVASHRAVVSMGRAVLNLQECYVAQGQPCDYCVQRCPLKGQAIDWDARGLPVINAPACTGCGVCVYLCPADALGIV